MSSTKKCPYCGQELSFHDICWVPADNSEQMQSVNYYCPYCKKIV